LRLNCTANRFVFERINRRIAPRTFSVKLAVREVPKCVLTSRQTASFLDAKIEKMRPELFLENRQDENFQNASELHSKLLHFWTHKSWNCAHNFLCKSYRQRTLEMRLNFTANCFVSRRKNRENAPRTFFHNPQKAKTSKMHLYFTANRLVFGRINREIVPRTFSVKLAARELPKYV